MGFIYPGAFLMAANGGFAFSTDCCCKAYTCYCYRHSLYYGSQTIEQRVLRYRVPEWDDAAQRWVFPDGQPCVPAGSRCTVTFVGIVVDVCSCAGGGYNGEAFSWVTVDCNNPSACPTILPPP
jgi:hypothetical protein